MNRFATDGAVNVLCLDKNGERYIWMYCDAQRDECLRDLGRTAANVELEFNWHDAAVLSNRIREMANG